MEMSDGSVPSLDSHEVGQRHNFEGLQTSPSSHVDFRDSRNLVNSGRFSAVLLLSSESGFITPSLRSTTREGELLIEAFGQTPIIQ